MKDFVHLHLHSEYSLLDGASRCEDIPRIARSLGQRAVAVTDHGNMYGAVHFFKACKREGIKPIIGCEVYVAAGRCTDKSKNPDGDNFHLILLVKNSVGYSNLIKLVSLSYTEGFYIKPRVDDELLRRYHEGLICLSGCVGGKIAQSVLGGNAARARQTAELYKDIFGDDFYLEIQDHGSRDEKKVSRALALLSRELEIPLVCTNDAHYPRKADADSQAALLCIQLNRMMDEGRPLGFENDEYYIKSSEEMEALFADYPEAVENTARIADKCNFEFDFNTSHLPKFDTGSGKSAEEYLRNTVNREFARGIMTGELEPTIFSTTISPILKRRISFAK